MDELFLVKLSLSFIFGSAFVTFCTFAAERFGTNIGGLIGGLPSTIAVTLLFIGLVESPEAASQATDIVPLIIGYNGLFLTIFASLATHGFLIGLTAALISWFLLTFISVALNIHSFIFSLMAFFIFLFVSYHVIDKRMHIPTFGSNKVKFAPTEFLSRALFTGFVISLAVYLAKVSGPILGGVLSVFPAIFISTLVIAYRAGGVDFSRALTKPLLISGMTNVFVYAVSSRYLFPVLGLFFGTVLAFAISGVSACATHFFIKTKMT